jgi:hypothetical protein
VLLFYYYKRKFRKTIFLRIKSLLKSKLNGNHLIKAVNTYAVPLLTYSFGVIKWSKTNLQNINIQTRVNNFRPTRPPGERFRSGAAQGPVRCPEGAV